VTVFSASFRPRVVALGASLLLTGCSFATEALWPSLTGDSPKAPPAQQQAQAPQPGQQQRAQPPLTQAAPAQPVASQLLAAAGRPAAGPASGTLVGNQVGGLRGELGQLQGRLADRSNRYQQIKASTTQNAQIYHGTVAAIGARLQLGTTPGNPVLVQQWNEAQTQLDRLSADIAGMNALGNEVTADASLANFLLDRTRGTYALSGAVDEDHRQLQVLEDEISRTQVSVDRLLHELTADIQRQTTYVGNERGNLSAMSYGIKSGQAYGGSLAARTAFAGRPPADISGTGASFSAAGRKPLVVIRFDRADVAYQQALYNAVSRALDVKANAQFDLVAVSPQRGSAAESTQVAQRARRSAEGVLRSLTEMGLPANRISLSTMAGDVGTNEVHVYAR